ncbi:MAG: glycosyltransferase family 10 domain-containing protein [Solirubrobacterales bacterium]
MASASWRDRWRMLGERTGSALLQRGLLPARTARPHERTLVLFYNTMFGAAIAPPAQGLPHGFELTTDLRRFGEARAVVFHIPSLGRIERLRKPAHQLWVAWWMECEQHFPPLNDPEFMGRFDLTMSHRLDADVPMPYLGALDESQLRAPPRPKRGLAALFMSGDRETSGRTAYAAELMRHMDVHSYGRVLRNRRLDEDRGRQTKLDTVSRYRFTLAFENAIAEDYVTEKLYDPLLAGSVPVYLGAPNVERLAPSPESYIDVRDYASPGELADRLLALASNEAAYDRHLAWKGRPFAPGFQALLDGQRTDAIVRLCAALRERL